MECDDFVDIMPVLQDAKIEDIRVLIKSAVNLAKHSPNYKDFAQEPHERAVKKKNKQV